MQSTKTQKQGTAQQCRNTKTRHRTTAQHTAQTCNAVKIAGTARDTAHDTAATARKARKQPKKRGYKRIQDDPYPLY